MTDIKTDCIYFEVDKEDENFVICKSSGNYCERAANNMCKTCRLWDDYTPKTATKEQIAYAQNRKKMSYEDLIKTNYYDYFKSKNMI